MTKFLRRILRVAPSLVAKRYCRLNQRIFPARRANEENPPVVLMEFNPMASAHIAYSYLANVLAEKHCARIKAYRPDVAGMKGELLFHVERAINAFPFDVYRSFGVDEFLEIDITDAHRARAGEIYESIVLRLKNKSDVEALAIDGVLIGDLVYDSYLRRHNRPTIELGGCEFLSFLRESLELFVFWDDYIAQNNVVAINVSHCVYTLAIPLRLAVGRGIPVYQANVTHIYRLTAERMFAYGDYVSYRERFSGLPLDVRCAGIEEAQRRVLRRFSGEVGVDMGYSTKSAFGAQAHDQLLRKSDRVKVLIATHCFFDSPHSYGNNVFPDFYEWLDFLGKISEETDYDWYIKTHPDYLSGTKEIIDAFVSRYPKFTLLPANASHHQIIAEGINVALTVYGTIAFEYAALGIPVINNSLCNPHIAYDFNIHSTSIEDYRRLLLGLGKLEFDVDRQQVYEYYFMRNIYNTENLFFNNYNATIKDLGGYPEQFKPVIYEKWAKEWSSDKHRSIMEAIGNFVDSGDFRMDYRHFGREFVVEHIREKS